jgi:hypothetical protein
MTEAEDRDATSAADDRQPRPSCAPPSSAKNGHGGQSDGGIVVPTRHRRPSAGTDPLHRGSDPPRAFRLGTRGPRTVTRFAGSDEIGPSAGTLRINPPLAPTARRMSARPDGVTQHPRRPPGSPPGFGDSGDATEVRLAPAVLGRSPERGRRSVGRDLDANVVCGSPRAACGCSWTHEDQVLIQPSPGCSGSSRNWSTRWATRCGTTLTAGSCDPSSS